MNCISFTMNTLPWMSIGYNVQMTPLQILNFYNTVANGGKMMKPRLVSQIKNGTSVVRNYPPQVVRNRICSQENP